MNLCHMSLDQFLIKLKGLIKKISSSNSTQLDSHSQKCHIMITHILQDDHLLQNLSSSKFRLLAYETILFLVQILSTKNQEPKSSLSSTSKIEFFLTQIYQTLADIKKLIQRVSPISQNGSMKDEKNNLKQRNNFDELRNNLHQYQKQLGSIITSFQSQNHSPSQRNQCFENEEEKQDGNDQLIEEMQRVIEKKEQKISSLTKLLEKSQKQNQELQFSLQSTINHLQTTNLKLSKQIDDSIAENEKRLQKQKKERQNWIQEEKIAWQRNQKNRVKGQLQITSVFSELIISNLSSLKHLNFNCKISDMAEQTLCSTKEVKIEERSSRKMSLDKAERKSSLRRIEFGESKDFVSSERILAEMNEMNEELYRFIFCQASTIEELF